MQALILVHHPIKNQCLTFLDIAIDFVLSTLAYLHMHLKISHLILIILPQSLKSLWFKCHHGATCALGCAQLSTSTSQIDFPVVKVMRMSELIT